MDNQSLQESSEESTAAGTEGLNDERLRSGYRDDKVRKAFDRFGGKLKFQLEPLNAIKLDTGAQWLITGLMPATGLHVLYGAPGTGKSFLALSVALHVAAGLPWCGKSVKKSAVVYVASEGGRNFRKRVVAARAALSLAEDTQFALVTVAPNLGGKKADTNHLIEQIRSQTHSLGWQPRLIVIDTLSRSIEDFNESSSQDVMDFVRNADDISHAFGAIVMTVHHCGKDESKGMRGSSALHGSADAEWMVSRHPKTGHRELTVEKMKDGPDGEKVRYDLVDVELGVDADGQKIVTCVAKVLDALAEAQSEPRVPERGVRQEDLVLMALKVLIASEGLSVEGSHLSADRKAVPKARLKDVVNSAELFGATMSDANFRSAFSRALGHLASKAIIKEDEKHICLVDPS